MAKILVLQNPLLAQDFDLLLSSPQVAGYRVYGLDESDMHWQLQTTENQSWKSKSRLYVFEAKSTDEMNQENSKLQTESSGGGGGGCLILNALQAAITK